MQAASPTRRLREISGIAAFTVSYLAVAAIATWMIGNTEFVFYVGVMVILVAGVWALDRRIRISWGVLWGLSAWGFLHMAGGLVPLPGSWPAHGEGQPVLYSLWLWPGRLKYDQVVHAFGFGVTTWLCWEALGAHFRARGSHLRPNPGLLILCAAAGMGFGALNEVVEFAATLLVPETNVGGYRNTGWDLVANLVGAILAVALIRWRGARDRPPR